MPLSVKKILSYLHTENITFQYYGSEFENIYAIRTLPDDYTFRSQNGIFYISSDTSLSSLLKEKNDCVLFTAPDMMHQVFQMCSDYLIWYQQKESLLLQFYEELTSVPSYTRLIQICCSILDSNPVLLLNEQLVLRMHSDSFNIVVNDSFLENVKHALLTNQTEDLVHIAASKNFPADIFIGKIERDNPRKTEYLCVIEQNPFLYEPDSLHYICTLCNALANHSGFIAIKSVAPSGDLNKLILSLLPAPPASPSSFKIKLAEAGWEEQEQYFVFAIDKQHKNHLAPDYEKIRVILNASIVCEYKNYIVAVLGCHYFEQPDESCLNALSDFLKLYHMSAGISNGFSDITMLSIFFNQSVTAIEINDFYNYTLNYRVVKYSDFSITHLLKIVSQSSNIRIIDFCHPTLLYIMEYDRKNHTDYLNTLSAYILSNNSIKLASQVLYIHANTMYNRIAKIRNDFKLDLDNITLIAQLYISFQILGVLQITDANVWARIHRSTPPKNDTHRK